MSALYELMLRQQPITEKQKSDLYAMITFLKLAADYAFIQGKEKNVRQEAKQLFNDVMSSTDRFIARLRAGIQSEAGKKGFTEAWQQDYQAWAAIWNSLSCMSPEQVDIVETFCRELLAGNVQVEGK